MRSFTRSRSRLRRTKRIQRTKKRSIQRGRGVEESWMDTLASVLPSTFPTQRYEMVFSSSRGKTGIGVDLYCSTDISPDDIAPITFSLLDDELFIHTLTSCQDIGMRGTDVLKGLIAVGKAFKPLGIQRIRLKDASALHYPFLSSRKRCTISLAGYMILTSKAHHSWYNSHGFRSDAYEEEVKHNADFAEQPMILLLRMTSAHHAYKRNNPLRGLFSKKSDTKEKTSWESLEDARYTEQLARELIEVYEGRVTPDTPIQEGIREIHRISFQADSCSDRKVTLYSELMGAAMAYGIRYNHQLTYTL